MIMNELSKQVDVAVDSQTEFYALANGEPVTDSKFVIDSAHPRWPASGDFGDISKYILTLHVTQFEDQEETGELIPGYLRRPGPARKVLSSGYVSADRFFQEHIPVYERRA